MFCDPKPKSVDKPNTPIIKDVNTGCLNLTMIGVRARQNKRASKNHVTGSAFVSGI